MAYRAHGVPPNRIVVMSEVLGLVLLVAPLGALFYWLWRGRQAPKRPAATEERRIEDSQLD